MVFIALIAILSHDSGLPIVLGMRFFAGNQKQSRRVLEKFRTLVVRATRMN